VAEPIDGAGDILDEDMPRTGEMRQAVRQHAGSRLDRSGSNRPKLENISGFYVDL
jgi:hypothetical protein